MMTGGSPILGISYIFILYLAIERPAFFSARPFTGCRDRQERIDEMRGKHGRELERLKAVEHPSLGRSKAAGEHLPRPKRDQSQA